MTLLYILLHITGSSLKFPKDDKLIKKTQCTLMLC